ncbi:hypothetical protein [Solemya elarraichensis gill symbiont]|uniref:Tyr recombinase domain-containing protein n=1 Tax=Solemya elarraichensis gill symbiont TaxID=1918949 RepID=A0A1T2LC82_9GAMM|nr:hypothetical protein [Solemya elarraichensis gill symbiont]OOZ42708.1 hypothetical protein BOW52_01885 [Solemya elarraichensis gill symbiont]
MPRNEALSMELDVTTSGVDLPPGEAAEVIEILKYARNRVLPFDGLFQAEWLLTDIRALTWHTTRKGKGGLVSGRWVGTEKIEWNQILPNGHYLGDEQYSPLLETLQKTSFLLRSGMLTGKPVGNRHWKYVTTTLINLGRYMVLHEHRYKPKEYALSLLDQSGLNHFVVEYAKGGLSLALEIPQRILSYFYGSAFGQACPEALYSSLFSLDDRLCKEIYEWAKDAQNLMMPIKSGAYKGRRVFSVVAIAKIANCEQNLLVNQKMRAFLRQFEIELQEHDLLVPANAVTRHPSHKAPLLKDALSASLTQNAVTAVTNHIALSLSSHRHLPGKSPNPAYLSIRKARTHASQWGFPAGRTPLMPVDIGLRYLNGALTLVHRYGDLAVSLYLEFLRQAKEVSGLSAWKTQAKHREIFASLIGVPKYALLRSDFDIGQFHANTHANKGAESMDAHRLIGHVVASCVILIAILKPSRDEELLELGRDCISLIEGDGYYLDFALGKSNVGEAYEATSKPIPYKTAKAIELVKGLGKGIDGILGTDTSDRLFVLPGKGVANIKGVGKNGINRKLDLFGDLLGIRLDDHQRRWYVRVHEMRKFFLLLFFWQGRFGVLDAAREIAGHTDVEHIYRYMEANYPRESFTEIEADYAVNCLSSIDQYTQFGEVDSGLERLREMVCDHFGVSSLEFVPTGEWEQYVRDLREDDHFKLEPHSIKAAGDGLVEDIAISFIVSECLSDAA